MFDLCFDRSRRNFLRVGGISALGIGLPSLLRAQAGEPGSANAAGKTDASRAKHSRRAKSVILVYLGGGLSHHDSFDLKPEIGRAHV